MHHQFGILKEEQNRFCVPMFYGLENKYRLNKYSSSFSISLAFSQQQVFVSALWQHILLYLA